MLAALSIPFTTVTTWAVTSIYADYGYFWNAVDIGSNGASYAPTLTVGWGNFAGASSSVAIGGSVVTHSINSLVVGTFNTAAADQVIPNGDTVFILGNGTGVPTDPPEVKKSNVLEIYKDGTIIINKHQGDISPGVYN